VDIIFCLSYLSVPNTISIIEGSKRDYLIVTSQLSIATFFRRLYSPEKIICLDFVPLLSKNPVQLMRNMLRVIQYKQEVWVKFKHYENANIYSFSMAFCEFESWLIQRLSVNNNVFYKAAVNIGNPEQDNSFYAKLNVWLRYIFYGIYFPPVIGPDCTYYTISDRYLSAIGAMDFDLIPDLDIVDKKIMSNLGDIKDAKVLILCGGTAGVECEKEEYIHKMDALIDFLVEKYGYEALAIKAHPRLSDYHSKENSLKKIPSDIAANLIVSHFDMVIGYATATLIEAANSGVNSVSLLKFIEPKVQDTQRYYMDYLVRNTKETIYFPTMIEEIVEVDNETG